MESQFHLDKVSNGLADHGYAVIDTFLSESEVDSLLRTNPFRHGLEYFKRAGIGKSTNRQINESIRSDYIYWISRHDSDPAFTPYFERVQLLMKTVNRDLFLSLKDFEVHSTIYPAGSFYKRHLDQFKKDDHRKLSLICYLNKNWDEKEGGQLVLYLPSGPLKILPESGRLVCFRSDQIEHEVILTKRKRLSITGWLLDRCSDLRSH